MFFRLARREPNGGREPMGLHLPNRVICGRGRCKRWTRSGLHPAQRTQIETNLSRMNSSWSSIQHCFCEHLSCPQTDVRTDQVVTTPELVRFSSARDLLHCSKRSEQSHGPDRPKDQPNCPVYMAEREKKRGRILNKNRPIRCNARVYRDRNRYN